jgi:hypothetical protein
MFPGLTKSFGRNEHSYSITGAKNSKVRREES